MSKRCLNFDYGVLCRVAIMAVSIFFSGYSYSEDKDDTFTDDLQAIAEDIRRELCSNILGCWYPACIDKKNGGYYQYFDCKWNKIPGKPGKGIVGQSRIMWIACKAAMLFPQKEEYRRYAEHGFSYINNQAWDAKYGGWFWITGDNASKKVESQQQKHAYGISFGIYACSAYYRLSGNRQALGRAVDAFRLLERYAHDSEYGGYRESFTRDWIPRKQDSEYGQFCPVGVWPEVKSMNTHIHLLEAFCELYRVWPQPILRERIIELLKIITKKMNTGHGALNQYMNRDWSVIPAAESFGHDVETTYLITEALDILKLENPEYIHVAKELTEHAVRYGTDRNDGSLYDLGDAFGGVFSREKIFWVQAEYLNTLLLLASKYPEEVSKYFSLFLRQWNFIKNNIIDRDNGGWFYSMRVPDEKKMTNKGGFWLDPYHNGRALMNCLDNLRYMAK